MGSLDWLANRTTYVYNYDLYKERIIKCPVIHKGLVRETKEDGTIIEKVPLSWIYPDLEHTFEYKGFASLNDGRILYINSYRKDQYEEVLSLFPYPANFQFDILWGVAVGITSGVPASFRVLLSSEELSLEQAEKEFEVAEAVRENSLIPMEYNPNKLQVEYRKRKELEESLKDKIIKLNEAAEKSPAAQKYLQEEED